MGSPISSAHSEPFERRIGRIPVRNLWLLMLYASDLTRTINTFQGQVDDSIDDLPDLVARLLADEVERRLRRNLTRGYRHREMSLPRVRGQVDLLTTETRQLLSKGEVHCRFEELTMDTPRNRLVHAALRLMGRARYIRNRNLMERCRSLATVLGRAGVGGLRPSRADLAVDQIGRNDRADLTMVALARLAFDLALPTEDEGNNSLVSPDREEMWVRKLFEKAILGFARVELAPLGWSVRGSLPVQWQESQASSRMASILPQMELDILIDPPEASSPTLRRLVIDTKFTSILAKGRFEKEKLKSAYIYQMYAYLRSQEGSADARWNTASGLLLHPAVDESLDEYVVIQHHLIRFATVNLSKSAMEIRGELRQLLRKAN